MRISDWSSDVCSSDLIEPVLAHFHEDEQMDRLAECLFHVLLRRLAHEPYGLAALAQADRLVLIAADVADLLAARRAVLESFSALGLAGPRVGQDRQGVGLGTSVAVRGSLGGRRN